MQQKTIQQLAHLFQTTRNLTAAIFTFLLINADREGEVTMNGEKRLATAGAVSAVLSIPPYATQPQNLEDLPVPDRLVSLIVTEDIRRAAAAAGRETFDLFCPAGQVYDATNPDVLLGHLYVERL